MRSPLTVARALALVAAVAFGYLTVTFLQVWTAGTGDGLEPAQAIVVLGAAQYDGRPSPVLQLRLDHAVDLYEDGYAPLVVVTGGNQPGDRSNEATVSAVYLHARGLRDEVILREVGGRNTWEQLAATTRFLRDLEIRSVILVTDPMHAHRVRLTAEEVGLEASVSPRSSQATVGQRLSPALRETVAVALGRFVSFRRLANLRDS